MKKIITILSSLAMVVLLSGWSLQEVIQSEGVETNVIQCKDGNTKVLYLNFETGKYEITPDISYNTFEEGVKNLCNEW
jgi:hypothetical protein